VQIPHDWEAIHRSVNEISRLLSRRGPARAWEQRPGAAARSSVQRPCAVAVPDRI